MSEERTAVLYLCAQCLNIVRAAVKQVELLGNSTQKEACAICKRQCYGFRVRAHYPPRRAAYPATE